MKGHIRKRGKESWQIKVFLGRDQATGKPRYRHETVRGLKRDAQRELTRILREIDTDSYVEPSKLTVADFLERWLSDHAQHAVSRKTLERYTEVVRKHLVPGLGSGLLAKLRPLDIQSYYTRALTDGRRRGPGGLNPQTVKHHHRILFQALRHAVRWQLIARNPAEAVDPPKVGQREMLVLTEAELGQLLKAAKGSDIYAPVLVTATTGMRRGELLGLRWSDVDLDRAELRISHTIEETREGLYFKEPKTPRSRRTIALPPVAVDVLRDHKAEQGRQRLALGIGRPKPDLVFSRATGEPYKPRVFSQAFRRLVTRAGVTAISFHGLRHTHLTHLLIAGVHPKVASERAGHASVSITLDRYSHVLPGLQEEAAQRVDESIRRALEE